MAATGSVDRDGFALDFVRQGSGIPMLILGPPRYYQRVFPVDLGSTFDIVFANLRLFVPAPPAFDVSTLSRATYSDDIEAVRRAAGLVRPVVVGHSITGLLALEYARRHPESTRGVVVIAAPPAGVAELSEHWGSFFEQDAGADRRAAHARNVVTRGMPTSIRTGQDIVDQYVANGAFYWFDPTFDATPLWEGVEPRYPAFLQLNGDLYGHYQLEPVEVPVFLALGRYDYAVPYLLWDDERKKRIGRLHYELYERSGHTPPYEEPQRFAADLIAWAESL